MEISDDPWMPIVISDDFLVRVSFIHSQTSYLFLLPFLTQYNGYNIDSIQTRQLLITQLSKTLAYFESFPESNLRDIFTLCGKNLEDSRNFAVRGYLLLIRKDYITRMHVLAINLAERLSHETSLKNSEDS